MNSIKRAILDSLIEVDFDRAYVRKLTNYLESPENEAMKATKISNKMLSDRKHADFSDISKSSGDITRYKGYNSIKESVKVLKVLQVDDKIISKCIDEVTQAVSILERKKMLISSAYSRSTHVSLEYDSYVYMIIQSITAILSQFVKCTINAINGRYEMKLVNSKYKAELFYFKQLEKFNELIGSKEYDTLCKSAIGGESRENFLGTILVGLAVSYTFGTVGMIVGLAMLVRFSVSLVFKARVSASKCLDEMADFLELRNSLLASNNIGANIPSEKKRKIMANQEKWIARFTHLSNMIRVSLVEDEKSANEVIRDNNIDIKTDVDNGILI